ncbi:MAG: CDP-glucose 4,6-dehydratase [Sphingomonadales bacterium]|nr:CDP-glucose 4,6-dehydratase [Sphingomonadales bacterium]
MALSANLDPAFWAGRRVLLTGHTGFKGSWLLLMLERLGAQVTGLSLAPETEPALFDQIEGWRRCHHHVADIRDQETVAAVMREARPEVVLHLAAQPLVRRSYADPIETFSTNVLGTAHVLEAVRALDCVRAVVSVTTDKCYANDGRVAGYREDDRLGGHDPYSNSKACAELVSQSYRDSFLAAAGIGLATARAGNVIGGGDHSADRLVVDVVKAFLASQTPEIRNPQATRPWQHVLEPLTGYCLLAERLFAVPDRFASGWNFGPEQAETAPVSRVVELLARHWGVAADFAAQPGNHPHEAATLSLDSAKAHDQLGWQPRLTLEQAVDMTADWYRLVDAHADPAVVAIEQIERYASLGEAQAQQAAA